MKFGVGTLPDYHPDTDGTPGEYLRNLLDLLASSEALGFDAIWANEHHFDAFGGVIPSPPVLLAALAERTRRVRLGTSIVVLPLYAPLEVAEQLAMVDLLSGGRLEFGVGRGYVPYDYEALGLAFEEGQARTTESLELILKAWSGEPFTHQGRYYSAGPLTVWPQPEQRPHPPVWIACSNNPQSFAWTARQGYNLLTIPYIKSVDQTAALTRVYRDAWAESGRDPAAYQIGSLYHVVVDTDGAAARRRAEVAMRRYMEANLDAQSLSPAGAAAARARRVALSIDTMVAEGRMIAGTPAECTAMIARLQAEIGFTLLYGQLQFGGIDFPTARRSMELFAQEVIPSLRGVEALA